MYFAWWMRRWAGYVSSQAKHPYDVALENLTACSDSIDRSQMPAMYEEHSYVEPDDPDRLRKRTSKVLIGQDAKDYILIFDSQYVRCSKNHTEDLSRTDNRLVSNYLDMMTVRTKIFTDILEGNIKTYGEFYTRADDSINSFLQRERQIVDAMNREVAQANAQAEAQRKQNAQIAWQNYQNSLNQSNQVMNNYLNSLNRQMETNSLNRMRTTNCSWIGDFFNCRSY